MNEKKVLIAGHKMPSSFNLIENSNSSSIYIKIKLIFRKLIERNKKNIQNPIGTIMGKVEKKQI